MLFKDIISYYMFYSLHVVEPLRYDSEINGRSHRSTELPQHCALSHGNNTRQLCVPASTAPTTLPDGEPLYNVTSLDNEIYVLRWKETEQVEVFDAGSYTNSSGV